MKNLIIYASIHHKNTEKIANAMGSVLGGEVVSFLEAKEEDLKSADLIGFGSGIYLSMFHKSLINFIENQEDVKGKKAFIFSTSGMKRGFMINKAHNHFKKLLTDKGYEVVGDFNCIGHDSYGPLKYIGGINKGRPDESDVNLAKEFANSLK